MWKQRKERSMTLTDWLQERFDNCIRIAGKKKRAERDGWIKDAVWFQLAMKSIAELEKIRGKSAPPES
jgi:hypothetical protein